MSSAGYFMHKPSARRCSRCWILFDEDEFAATTEPYALAWQLQDIRRGFGCYQDNKPELDALVGDKYLRDKGFMCCSCLADLKAQRVQNDNPMIDGAYQVPGTVERQGHRHGWDLCPDCETNYKPRGNKRCTACKQERRKAVKIKRRPGRGPALRIVYA